MFVRILLFILLSVSATAEGIFNPKIIGKFNYLGGTNIEKYAGALALENEFFSFLSAGFQAGAGMGKLKGDEQGNTVFVDLGLYIKPQIAIDLTAVTLTPYLSFYLGFPSFTNKESNGFVFTQNYSTLLGLEVTFAQHLIVLAEGGVGAISRMVAASGWHFPGVVYAGLGWRF